MPHHRDSIVPLLADIQEQNVVFVVYTSESNPSHPCSMKELLIKTLFSLSSKQMDIMINIISCASKVLKWQNELVKCSLPSIMDAAAWIRTLQMNSKVKVSVWSAMEEAMEDPTCQAVYLFTSGLPEHCVEEICRHLHETKLSCPLHIVQLVENGEDKIGSQTWDNIVKLSGGTFQAISGASREDNTGCKSGIHHSDSINHLSFPLLSHHYSALFPLGTCGPDTCKTFLGNSIQGDLGVWSPNSHSLLRGIRVLARRETDGYYYIGHIIQKIKDTREYVLIEFERCQRSRKGKVQFQRQETPLFDIIHYEDARWQPLSEGDGTLAPWEKKGKRYGPGIVLQVEETRSDYSAFKNTNVLISFWNGQTKILPADLVAKIPFPLYERIVLEFHMPPTARQLLVEQSVDYPCSVPPGYRVSGSCNQNNLAWIPKVHCVDTMSTHLPPWSFCCPLLNRTMSQRWAEDTLIPRNSLPEGEWGKKIEEQISKDRLAISENNKDAKENLAGVEDQQSKLANPSKEFQTAKDSEHMRNRTGTLTDVAASTENGKLACFQPSVCKSSAQPSQRNTSHKTYFGDSSQLQATLDWVNKSLKKDCLAIESVLPIRRSNSAPVQRLMKKEVPQNRPREMDLNPARMEFKRQKWEQRYLKEAQHRQEIHHKSEMLLENRRQRTLQRTLQNAQNEQEKNSRAKQNLEQLQAARAERTRLQTCLREEEWKKENQRAEFLKSQHEQREKQLAECNHIIDDLEKKRLELFRSRKQAMQKNEEEAVKKQETENKEKEAAKCHLSQKRAEVLQQVEKQKQTQKGLQQFLREQNLLMLRASMLP